MRKLTTEELKRRLNAIFNGKYDFSNVEYNGYHVPVKVICPFHGEIFMTPSNLLQGKGCKRCYHDKPSKRRNDRERVIEQIKAKNVMGYEIIEIGENVRHVDRITLRCTKKFKNGKEHGNFSLTINNFLRGKGCPICKSSHMEKDLLSELTKNGINFVFHQQLSKLIPKSNQTLDFYLPDIDVAIECQGRQHFEAVRPFGGDDSFKHTIELDINKFNLCREHGINLLYLLPPESVRFDAVNSIQEIYRPENTFKTVDELMVFVNTCLSPNKKGNP